VLGVGDLQEAYPPSCNSPGNRWQNLEKQDPRKDFFSDSDQTLQVIPDPDLTLQVVRDPGQKFNFWTKISYF
jgi:hypothetical protein